MNFRPIKLSLQYLAHTLRVNACEGLHTSRHLSDRKNHYEVLNLQRDCSPAEIRESFIDLAKKHHPDTNRNEAGSHSRFIELQTAYSVLSVPSKRQEYDLSLTFGHDKVFSTKVHRSRKRDFDYQQEFSDEFKDFYRQSRNPDWGPNPEKRIKTSQIIFMFVAFTTVGAVIQFYVIRWMYQRSYNDEMYRHERASASFYALKQEMDRRAEDYDVRKLRAAYFKEMGQGPIGMHLVPSLIRPQLPDADDGRGKAQKDVKNQELNQMGS